MRHHHFVAARDWLRRRRIWIGLINMTFLVLSLSYVVLAGILRSLALLYHLLYIYIHAVDGEVVAQGYVYNLCEILHIYKPTGRNEHETETVTEASAMSAEARRGETKALLVRGKPEARHSCVSGKCMPNNVRGLIARYRAHHCYTC